MGRDKAFGDVVVPADAVDSMISKLEEALAGLEGGFAGVWSYLLPDAKICLAELELIREVIQGAEGTSRAAGVLKPLDPGAKRHRHALESIAEAWVVPEYPLALPTQFIGVDDSAGSFI